MPNLMALVFDGWGFFVVSVACWFWLVGAM
jgi:hypothetical protein